MQLIQALALAVMLWQSAPARAQRLHHFVFFEFERGRIRDTAFLSIRALEGAQLKYSWRELEPARNHYDFSAIEQDLRYLSAHGKRLFVQLQEVSFDSSIVNVPDYLRSDPAYGGGAALQYDLPGDDEGRARASGWVARRWDPAVRRRFQLLLAALGRSFDGRIAGINLPETAVDFGTTGRLFPSGFTFGRYRDAVIENMRALKAAFPRSVAMQYANFMPGEWLPGADSGYLRSVYDAARESGVAVGGPDLLPHRRGQLNHSYPLIRASSGVVATGIAVQWGNYEERDPATGRQITIAELVRFAGEWLRVDYIFWSTQEPFYSRDVLPMLRALTSTS